MPMLEAGHILHDRYRLRQKLGQHPGRQTWLAEDLAVTPVIPVVVKLLTLGGEIQWEHLRLFEREAQVLKQLNHPQIPKYLDYFSIDDRSLWFGLVETYIPGYSLKELLLQGRSYTETDLRKLATSVLKILIYLHGLSPPLLHRDIKPGNVIWGDDGQIYLVDFGAVQDRALPEGGTFTVVGTYGYVPMEQFGGRTVPASDLYAFGMTLIHLMTGTAPADLPQDGLRVVFDAPTGFSPEFVQWVQIMTEPALKQRFATAPTALEALSSNQLRSPAQQPFSPVEFPNNSGMGKLSEPVPTEVLAWNWGAFILMPLWCLDHRLWRGLLIWVGLIFSAISLIALWPPAGLVLLGLSHLGTSFVLGANGNFWAWKSKKWRSIEHFKGQQRAWAVAGLAILPLYLPLLVPLLLAVML